VYQYLGVLPDEFYTKYYSPLNYMIPYTYTLNAISKIKYDNLISSNADAQPKPIWFYNKKYIPNIYDYNLWIET